MRYASSSAPAKDPPTYEKSRFKRFSSSSSSKANEADYSPQRRRDDDRPQRRKSIHDLEDGLERSRRNDEDDTPRRGRSARDLEDGSERSRRYDEEEEGKRKKSPTQKKPKKKDVEDRMEEALQTSMNKNATTKNSNVEHDPYKPTPFDVRSIPFVLRKLHTFVHSPAPFGGGVVVRCFIERNRSGTNAFHPVYKLYTDHDDGTGRFIMAARKMPSSKTPHYVFSTSAADLYKSKANRGRNYLGKLRGNGATTSYVLYEKGAKPGVSDAEDEIRRELGAFSFAPRRGRRSSNPRYIEVALPQVRWRRKRDDEPEAEDGFNDDGGVITVEDARPIRERDGLEHMLTLIQGQGAQNVLYADKVAVCHLRQTRYDALSSCLVDFKARASVASTKNFQLVKSPPLEEHMKQTYYKNEGAGLDPNHDVNAQPVLLQMGKVGKNCFNMDYQFPFSMFQAFAVCVARFDTSVDVSATAS